MFYDVYLSLCKRSNKKPSVVAAELGINKSNVSNWKNNGYTPRGDTLQKIADYFGVTTDYLLTGEEIKKAPDLTEKDRRDIERRLSAMIADLSGSADGLMFDGEPIDDETRQLLEVSLRNQLEISKRLAKQKFTPKKYRKEGE